MVWGLFGGGWVVVGGGLGLVLGWLWGVVGGQWDGEIRVTVRAGLISHWPARGSSCDPPPKTPFEKPIRICMDTVGEASITGQWLVPGS